MKPAKKVQSMMTQFGYDHKNVRERVKTVKKSADELSNILEKMGKKGKKE